MTTIVAIRDHRFMSSASVLGYATDLRDALKFDSRDHASRVYMRILLGEGWALHEVIVRPLQGLELEAVQTAVPT